MLESFRAMDYYEELGLHRSASEEEVRKAHRRLAKLLHPDQQTDDAVKALAETQMRRLNGIVQVLANPRSRMEYDREQNLARVAQRAIRFAPPVFTPESFGRPPGRQILVWTLCSALSAILFTLGGVWWLESRSGPLFGADVQAYEPRGSDILSSPNDPSKVRADVAKAAVDPLVGEWIYVPHDEEKRSGYYVPESISLKLFPANGKLLGEYHARYAVADRPVPPDVNLLLVATGPDEHDFTWQTPGGARGTFRIVQMDDNSIRTVWETTVYSRDSALTSGAATLERRTS